MRAHTQPPVEPASAEGLPIVTEIESHFIAHAVQDARDWPVVQKGDFVIVDPTDTTAVDGSIVLVEWSIGKRSLVSVGTEPCEWMDGGGVRLHRDGPHLAWWARPLVRPRSPGELVEWRQAGRIARTSEGPLRAEHLNKIAVGRVIGVAAKGAATEWAHAQCAVRDTDVDRRALRAAELFDAALYIELRDRTGSVAAIYESEDSVGVMSACTDYDHAEAARIYKEHAAVFAAQRDGLGHAKNKLVAELRRQRRVITLAVGEYRADPAMPEHVRSSHFGRRQAEVAQ